MFLKSFTKWSYLLPVLSAMLLTNVVSAADQAFVGVLALAVEEDVAEQLQLSDEVRTKLRNLVNDREDAAIELALKIKSLSPEQREASLSAFVAESESQGFALLTDRQRERLRQIRVARDGAATLAEPAIAEQLQLNDEQRSQIVRLIEQRDEAMTRGGEEQRRITRATYERQLMAVLDREQRAGWERLAGLAAVQDEEATAVAAADGAPQEGTQETTAETAENAPAATAQAEPEASPPEAAPPPVTAMTEPPVDGQVDEPPAAPQEPRDVRLKFNFRFAPWKDVLDWFAEQADLSLVLDAPPPGTFNYTDSQTYTPAKAIDLLNSVLLTKGFTLVRHDRMLMLINLEDGIPANLVTRVTLEELDEVGEYELVSCLFELEKLTAAEAEAEISKLLGPQGNVVTLPMAQQVLVTETGGRLRTIRRVIERIEQPQAEQEQAVVTLPLQHVTADEVLVVARQLLGLPEEQNAATDGSIRIAVDPLGTKFFVTGETKMVSRFGEILKLVDVPADLELGDGSIAEPLQLEVYLITDADPASVFQVMQTLMSGMPDVRLASDPKTGNLIALARPSQHATIKATLDQMQRDAQQVEVLRLRVVDPQLAVLSINKLFGAGEEGEAGRNAPIVDADPLTRQLLIRGKQNQIDQIRALLEKMGESDSDIAAADEAERGNVRMLPITGSTAQAVLNQVQQVWPSMRSNRIRVVTPSRGIRSVRPGEDSPGVPGQPPFSPDDFFDLMPLLPGPPAERGSPAGTPEVSGDAPAKSGSPDEANGNEAKSAPSGPSSAEGEEAAPAEPAGDRSAARPRNRGVQFFFVAAQAADPAAGEDTVEPPAPVAAEQRGPDSDGAAAPEIVISVGPGGIMIASQDLEALDELEALITAIADRMAASSFGYTVFYLKYARADVAAELLEQILGASSDGGGGGSLLGDIAGGMLGGGSGGGLMGSLLGLGGGDDMSLETTGAVTVVPDLRLNALIVQANATDLDLIEQLLDVIDQEASPEEVETIDPPKLIPVFYTNAQEVATVVRQVFARQIASSSGGGGQRQPSPEEFLRALRGGRGGRNDQSRRTQQEQQMMTVGVDERSNSLVVSAPEPLLRQVEQLVEQLDEAGVESEQTMRAVSIHKADPIIVQQALSALLGQPRSSTSRTGTSSTGRPPTTSRSTPSSSAADQFRQRMMMLNSMRNATSSRPASSPAARPTTPSRGPVPRGR